MQLARSSFYLSVANISLAVLTALNFFFLAASLSPKELGILSILLAIPSVGLSLLSIGYNKAAIYYIGRTTYSLETVLSNGLIICLILEGCLSATLLVLGSLLQHLFSDISLNLLYFAIVSIPVQIFLFYLSDACLAANFLILNIVIRFIPPITYVVGCLVASTRGMLSAGTAFILYVLGITLADVMGLGLVIYQSDNKRLFKPDMQAARNCLHFGGKAQGGEIAHYLAVRLDLVLVGFWAGMEASGFYSMASRLAETIWLVAYSTQAALSAKVAQSFEDSLLQKGQRLERTVRYMATGSLVIGLGVIGASFVIFKYLLPQYQPAFPLLLALTPGQIALAIFLLLVANLIGDGYPWLATKVRFILFGLALLFYLTLIPTVGALGAGLATSIAYGISTLITAIILARMYQLNAIHFLIWKQEDRALLQASKQYLAKYFVFR
jgi:O-antigen/teichoic acid export membrane protein